MQVPDPENFRVPRLCPGDRVGDAGVEIEGVICEGRFAIEVQAAPPTECVASEDFDAIFHADPNGTSDLSCRSDVVIS